MSKVTKSVDAGVVAPLAAPVVELNQENFAKLRSALIREVELRKGAYAQLQAQQLQISALVKGLSELRSMHGALALKLTEQQGASRKDKFIAALRDLCAERGLPAGTQLPERDILQRMRETEALTEQKTPMAVAPAQAEEVLDF